MTFLTGVFALVVALIAGAVVLSLSVLFQRGRRARRLFLALFLLLLAVLTWIVGILNPLPLP